MPLTDPEDLPDYSSANQNTYSGSATFLCSSKITANVTFEVMCEILAESDAFTFAMTNRGRLYYEDRGRLRSQLLNIKPTITEQGMTVSGHREFLDTNPGDANTYAMSTALNLHLSESRLFNTAFGFPSEGARVFMRPFAIKYENTETYELVAPYIRLYKSGIISISLPAIMGFANATIQKVVHHEVNKSRLNVASLLCEKELHLACSETQLSQMSRRDRLSQRKSLEKIMTSALNSPQQLNFATESLTLFELLHTDQLTLTDIARNLLSLAARTIAFGCTQKRINWYANQYNDRFVGQFWCGKPVINIRTHTAQLGSAAQNWAAQKDLVNSVLTRHFPTENAARLDLEVKDLRHFDDFNNFYSESVSLMLASSQVEPSIETQDSYSFDNLTSDIQILNEAAHHILTYYTYASLEIEECKTATDVARLEINILEFEETLLSAHKYGEVAKYIEEVLKGDHLIMTCKLLHKKIETIRKALELDEKISSESFNRRITIIFGIIASAALSPELMQPLAKYFDVASANENINRLYGIAAAIIAVASIVTLTHFAIKAGKWLRNIIN